MAGTGGRRQRGQRGQRGQGGQGGQGQGGQRGQRGGQGQGGHWEGLLLSLVGPVTVEDDRPAFLVLVRHQAGVLEMCYEGGLALDPCICDLTLLLRVELFPLLVVELFVKWYQRGALDKIDESISHIAFVLEINRKVEKIVGTLVTLVDSRQQHTLTVLVGNVFDHQGSPLISPGSNTVNVENILRFILLLSFFVLGLCQILARRVWVLVVLSWSVWILPRGVLILSWGVRVLPRGMWVLPRGVILSHGI